MLLDAFGPDAAPLLVAGSLGGLMRGLVVFRSVIAKGPVTRQVIINTLLDTGTSIVIGSIISLFLHGIGAAVLGAPFLNQIAIEGTAREATEGFLSGFLGIAVGGALWDFSGTIDWTSIFRKKGTP